MSALPIRSESSMPMRIAASTGVAANAWLLRHHEELVSRATAVFAWLDPDSRDEAVGDVIAKAVAWAHSAARRGRLHRLTAFWLVVYASRQYRQGRRFAGDNCRCAMSEAAKIKHGVKVASFDDEVGTNRSRPRLLRESLADRDAENPYEAARRAIDYPTIFALEAVHPKAIATFEYLVQTKSEGRQRELATELCVSEGRITQLKDELADALSRHGYWAPLGCRPSTRQAASTAG